MCLLDEKAFEVLKAALTTGVNVWDGVDFYDIPDSNHLMNCYFTAYPEDAEKDILAIEAGFLTRAF